LAKPVGSHRTAARRLASGGFLLSTPSSLRCYCLAPSLHTYFSAFSWSGKAELDRHRSFESHPYRVCRAFRLQLLEHVGAVNFHCAGADTQGSRYQFVRQTLSHAIKHLPLTRAELVK